MSPREDSINLLITQALNTSNLEEMAQLQKCPYMLVRRALAKNSQLSKGLVDLLSRDPVLNVSYIASKHPKCSQKREFDAVDLTPCVVCTVDERKMECETCQQKSAHKF